VEKTHKHHEIKIEKRRGVRKKAKDVGEPRRENRRPLGKRLKKKRGKCVKGRSYDVTPTPPHEAGGFLFAEDKRTDCLTAG